MRVRYCDVDKKHKIIIIHKKQQQQNNKFKRRLPVSNVRTPRAVSARLDPSLFVAVHMYVPVSSGLKS